MFYVGFKLMNINPASLLSLTYMMRCLAPEAGQNLIAGSAYSSEGSST